MQSEVKRVQDWFWACRDGGPAGDVFVIENGEKAFWSRVHREIGRSETCPWNAIHRGHKEARLEHILDMLLTVVPMYQVNYNKFMFEAVKIPAFAKFLRHSRSLDLCNYVSNPVYSGNAVKPEPYSDENTRKLGSIISATLNIDEDWF